MFSVFNGLRIGGNGQNGFHNVSESGELNQGVELSQWTAALMK